MQHCYNDYYIINVYETNEDDIDGLLNSCKLVTRESIQIVDD